MNSFRFSCDTNILISGSFYYRFQGGDIIFSEETFHSDAKFILDYFKSIFEKQNKRFGIITYSIKKELNDKKINILLKKLKDRFSSEPFKKTILSEFSALLNTINNNLKAFYEIFDLGKANINNKRVKRIKKEVDRMYDEFTANSENLSEQLAYDERERGRLTISKKFTRREIVRERLKKRIAEHRQIIQLKYKQIDDTDKNILSEIIYENRRFLQENPSLSKDFFKFYFVSNDTHFSPKYHSLYNCCSSQITDKIKNLFCIDCCNAIGFKDLINKKTFTD